jgi:hypothetical protein
LEFVEARKGDLFAPGYREKFSKLRRIRKFVARYGTDEDDDLEKLLFGPG